MKREWQSKSRRKTCHHSTPEINETEGDGKAKYGESTAAKKGSYLKRTGSQEIAISGYLL